jgi:2-dehydropantoate 2-reductase
MRILVVGAGVIGSIYAGKLLQAGHAVVMLARGRRLSDMPADGLVLREAESGQRTQLSVPTLSSPDTEERCDLVLVPVRAEQLESTLPILFGMDDNSDVVFFGNTAGYQAELAAAFGERALFGFPAAGGVLDGSVIKYVLIRQQKTMLGEPNGRTSPRLRKLQELFRGAGFPTDISSNICDWMFAHTAFVVPIGFALYRVGTDPGQVAADSDAVEQMVRATREAFRALRTSGNSEIPANLRILYLLLPTALMVRYWRRVLVSPRGELWFGAHSRAAPEEMHSLAKELLTVLSHTGRPTPHAKNLLSETEI